MISPLIRKAVMSHRHHRKGRTMNWMKLCTRKVVARIVALLFVMSILVTVAAPAFAQLSDLFSMVNSTVYCLEWSDEGICVRWLGDG